MAFGDLLNLLPLSPPQRSGGWAESANLLNMAWYFYPETT